MSRKRKVWDLTALIWSLMYFGIILHAKWICFPDPFRAVQIWVKVTIAETQSSALREAGNERYEIV